ncbi:MAG: sensor histidine kinase [Deltaproteobacteria bacterium]|nr:sensor histidine kinase [Deltaproteobacteria bacterium]MCF8119952.1 sensor histidine kinase [Deltaproteobacteria bacterium]
MEYQLDKQRLVTSLALTGVFNTIIALFLTQLGFGGGFRINFIFSQAIGLCICLFILVGHLLVRGPSLAGHIILLLVTLPAGAAAGSFLGALVAGVPFSGIVQEPPTLFIQMLFIGILFGGVITYFFFSREKISQTETRLQQEQIRSLTLEKKSLETHLRLLQAQIEPHFLFNTLSNILSLLDTDPIRGKSMLMNLTQYLRSSLSRTRDRITTLGQEMDLVQAYLKIHRVRMGERLTYTIDVPDRLRDRAFPPMLVQPLVENALIHGLEPQVTGGDILVRVEDHARYYRLTVSDTGPGLPEETVWGVGLTNVAERLGALFYGKASLILEENSPTGLRVTLEIPHE